MIKTFLPVLAIAAALGLYFVYVQPIRTDIVRLQTEEAEFDNALQKITELESIIERLDTQLLSYSSVELEKIERIIPDEVNNLQLILDLDGLTTKHNLDVTTISVGSSVVKFFGADTDGPSLKTYPVNLHIKASYSQLISFLSDVEKSLQLFDISEIQFQEIEAIAEVNNFIIVLSTYSLQ